MNNKGFTLVEVLVSLALVSVIAIFLFQIIFIVRDIYAEKNIKSEIYIESANISNVINKDIFEKDKDGIYIKNINKVSNDELYITYSDGIKSNIIINRENNTITYGNYTVSILDVADIGNIELYYNYDTSTIDKNGICYIKIPITHEDYKNDFGVVITYRYDSSKTRINGEISIRPGRPDNECSIALGNVWNFDYTGNVQEFSVPCEGTYKLEAWGAQGGEYNSTIFGGHGGYVSGLINLSEDTKFYIYVGGSGYCGLGQGDIVLGGFNGGGDANSGSESGVWSGRNFCSGGGSTDIRFVNSTWNDFNSLKSRIIVAGGGGGANQFGEGYCATGGNAGGLYGYRSSGICTKTQGNYSLPGYQNSGYAFGLGDSNTSVTNGGGSGYYGGYAKVWAGGAGGSSFISGYSGCNAIAESSTSSNIVHTNQPNHYSGKVFTNAVMIDGAGCNWSTGSATNCGANQPQPDGTNAIGHAGNGYARITLLSY